MSIMIVDAAMAAKFDGADDVIRICATDGRVLGYFAPAKAKKLNLNPPISEEELDRIEAQQEGRPLADILRDLETRS